jgi:hypothetical protein
MLCGTASTVACERPLRCWPSGICEVAMSNAGRAYQLATMVAARKFTSCQGCQLPLRGCGG